MKHITGTYNKTTTIIESDVVIENGDVMHKNSQVVTFRTKKEFYNWAVNQEAMNLRITQNINGFIRKMESLGFEVQTNSEGCFDWELNAYCSK